jgi:PAS domain S-box-containing protein
MVAISNSETSPIKILLVDDRPENLVVLKAILNHPEYHLLSATSGKEALQIGLREKLTVILLDVVMPEMDGFEVARHLRKIERTRAIPIIFLTAVATDVQQIYGAYEIGAVDYLIKPLDSEVVRKKVAVFVDLVRQREEIERQGRLLRESERREFELRLAEMRFASDRRYRKLVQGIGSAIAWSADENGRLTFLSRQATKILGLSTEQFIEPDFWQKHLHPDDREAVLALLRKARTEDTQADLVCDHRLIAADGRAHWFHTAVSGEQNDARSPELHGISIDVTDLKGTEVMQALRAELGNILSESLDYRKTLPTATRRLLPHLADWCLVDEVIGPSRIQELAAAHADPVQEVWVQRLERRQAVYPSTPIAHVLRTGQAEVHGTVPSLEWMAEAIGTGQTELLRALGAASCMFVPLLGRGRAVALMTCVSTGAAHRFGPTDVALAEDLGHRIALAIDNARLYWEAQEAARTREELLAIVAHDLNTPLTAIKASADLLQRQAAAGRLDPAPAVDGLARISRAATGMAVQIADLIDATRLRAGQPLELMRRPTDLVALVYRVAGQAQQVTTRHTIDVQAATPEQVGKWDTFRLERVVTNLLSNAVKYSPDGGAITVRIWREDEPEPAGVFCVQDSGIGVPAPDLSRIFERYQRAHNVAGTLPGDGIGLAGAKQIVEQHGGRISVESKEGSGSTFTVWLPLGEAASQPAREN